VTDVASSGGRPKVWIESQPVGGTAQQELSAAVTSLSRPPLVFSSGRGLTAYEVCCHNGNALEVLGARGSRPRRLDTWADYVDPGSRTPAWSPTGDLIAYARVGRTRSVKGIRTAEWEIAVIAPNGTRRHVLTSDTASPYVEPVFSPDGRSILFCADGPDPGLFTVPAAGGHVVQVARGACDGDVVAWSPNGREFAYVGSARDDVTGALFVIDTATGRAERVAGSVQNWSASGAPIYDWPATGELAWSPDGKKLAFAGSAAVETVDADGTGLRKVVEMRGSRTYSVAWSPNGRRVAFTAQHIFTCRVCTTY
jgi:Tol biopolymer transport system component